MPIFTRSGVLLRERKLDMGVADSTSLRPVKDSDKDLVFNWRNDPLIVALSSSQKTISRAEHEAWFPEMLKSPDIKAFIIEAGGQPAGQLRFEKKPGGLCEVTIYLMAPYKGQGHGPQALRRGVAEMKKIWPGVRVVAYIRSDNRASIAAFAQGGFRGDKKAAPPRPGHDIYVLDTGQA